MRVVSYNSRGLQLGQDAGAIIVIIIIVIDKLFENAEVVCLQETFLAIQDLDKLNIVHNDFHGAGESTTDLNTRIGGSQEVWPYSGTRNLTLWSL